MSDADDALALRPYQSEALLFLAERGRAIYADAPGTGKTATALRWLADSGLGTTLIVAPKAVLDHWDQEAGRWYPDLHVIRGDGTARQREVARDIVQIPGPDPCALLLNYEAMRQDIADLVDVPFDALIVDEAHRLKGRSTLVTKAARRIARRVQEVALLTGTPIMNRADELWSLLNLLDPDKHTSYWRFAHEFFEVELKHFRGNPRPTEIVGEVKPEKLEDLRALVRPTLIQRTLDECLPGLPQAVEVRHPVHLTPAERKVYRQMEQHKWADFGDGRVLSAVNDLAKMTRLRQMVSNMPAVLGEDFAGSKASATIELVRDLEPEQVVVLTSYKSTAYAIAGAVEGAVVYTGDQTQEERGRVVSAFRSGEARVLVGTLATLGEGVDGLQGARYLVMVDRDWTPARNEQAIARLRRSGQTQTVVVYHVYAEDTIDEMVADALLRKDLRIADVLGDSPNEAEMFELISDNA